MEYVALVESGTVALFNKYKESKISISELVFEGELFGYSSNSENQISAMALSDVIITAYPVKLVMKAQQASVKFSTMLLQDQLERIKRSERQIQRISHYSALEAVADFIIELATHQNGDVYEGLVVELPLNRFKTADYLGITFETVSRSFSRLRKMGVIDFSNSRHVIVKKPAILINGSF